MEGETKRMNDKEGIPGACSCMTLTSKTGKHYWFRTCDIDTDIWRDGAHVVQQAAGKIIEYGNGKKEISRYSFTGMTYSIQDTWLLDGVNEYGLTGGLLMLYEGTSVEKAEESKEGYIGMELVTKVLSSCRSVEEVITLAEQIQVLDIPFKNKKMPATMHYFFVDRSGNNAEAVQWWTSTMWWLCGADTVLPVGDIIYGTGILILGVYALTVADEVTMPQISLEEENSSVYEYREHTKGARQSTKGKHQKGQTRKNRDNRGEKGDARRYYIGNKKKLRMFLLIVGDLLYEDESAQVVASGGAISSGFGGGGAHSIFAVNMLY